MDGMKRAAGFWIARVYALLSTVAGLALAQVSPPQVAPFELKVETGPGLVAYTFSISRGQARAYFPDDVAPGERFSGALEGESALVFEFAGQGARVRDASYQWRAPEVKPGEFVPLILRDGRGRELARASVQIAPPRAAEIASQRAAAAALRFPKFLEQGSPASVLGPFDGDAASTEISIAGKPAQILAESAGKAVFRVPQNVSGAVAYALKERQAEQRGTVRALSIRTTMSPGFGLTVEVKGLDDLDDDVPLLLDHEIFFIRPANVRDGTYTGRAQLLGIEQNIGNIAATLVFPQTQREEVALRLRVPLRNRTRDIAEERGEAVRKLGYDAFPVLQDLLGDPDAGGDAAYAMLGLDETRAMPILLASMPGSGANIERIGFSWLLAHPSAVRSAASEAHAAALRVLSLPGSSTDAIELALLAVGMTGNTGDLPLLERTFQYRNGWAGRRRVQDASEAAMARLGSPEHMERIRAELAAPLPPNAAPEQAIRTSQILQKAGFVGEAKLIPLVCLHLSDPAIVDIDVTWDPKLSAVRALHAIVNHTTPLAAEPAGSLQEWSSYCAALH
jgi:hypothetical protein